MEKEHLLAHQKTGLLTDMLKSINRNDVVCRIQEYSNPAVENAILIRAGPPIRGPVNGTVNRSPSAGTLSVSNSESDMQGIVVTGQIPAELMTNVAREDKWTDFAIELGLSNDEIGEYEKSNPDKILCIRAAVDNWFRKFHNWRETLEEQLLKFQEIAGSNQNPAPEGETQGHRIALSTEKRQLPTKLGRVISEEQNINFTVNTGEAQSVFSPAGPPAENQYVSYNTAQPMQQNLPTEEGIQLMELETQMNALNPRQFWMSQVLQHRTWSEPGYTQVTSGPPDRINSEPVVNTSAINQPLVFPVMQPLPEIQNGQQQRVEVQAINENQRNNRAVAADSGEQLPVYPMSKRPRGWCVIINNRDFYVNSNDNQGKEMPQRSGTDVDAQSLQHVFETLGFIVRRRDNLTDTQMMQFLIDVAHNVDHTNFECFVCCILTHGVLNHLYGTNGRLVSIKDLTSMFQANRCPTLVGKPKLFFLQACQGRDKMTGGELGGNIQRDAGAETDTDKEMIPNEADFVIGYATVPGYVSFRSRTHGSWYIRKLCELLEKLSHKEDLMSILVQVNNEVSKANANLEDGVYKQTPAPLVTLRKKLYFL